MRSPSETMTRGVAITSAMLKTKKTQASFFVRNRVRLLIEYVLIAVAITSLSLNVNLAVKNLEQQLSYEQEIAVLTIQRDDQERTVAMLREKGSAPIPESACLNTNTQWLDIGK
jgi:hypothetical protein